MAVSKAKARAGDTTGDTRYESLSGPASTPHLVSRKKARLKVASGAEQQSDNYELATPTAAGAKVTAAGTTSEYFQVLLAGTWDRKKDITGYWISEKFDGARAYWNGRDFISRHGNIFHAPEWFKDGLPDYPLDGELWFGYNKVGEGNGLLMTRDPSRAERWKDMRFLIFDAPGVDLPFEERMAFIAEHHAEGSHPYSRPVKQTKAASNKHVLCLLAEVQASGGEGLVAREPGSRYENKRSLTMLKIKTFFDAEAVVIGYKLPNMKISYGDAAIEAAQMGATGIRSLRARILVDTLPDIHKEEAAESAVAVEAVLLGAEFGITMQGKWQANPPPPGTVVNFKYMELTPNQVPRHPTWLGVREDYSGPEIPAVESMLLTKA